MRNYILYRPQLIICLFLLSFCTFIEGAKGSEATQVRSRRLVAWDQRIMAPKTGKILDQESWIKELTVADIIVLGEKHYNKEVQNAQGDIIRKVVTAGQKEQRFSLSWEFLNASAQEETRNLFSEVVSGTLSVEDFLIKTQKTPQAKNYAPMIEATRDLGGSLFGVNLSREEKAPVVKWGLSALDPKLLPPYFQMGGSLYSKRFTKTMEDHATPEQIVNYFAAQCLVDDVSAYHLTIDSDFDLKFLVIGAFHSQYNDGVVERLKMRNQYSHIINIEIIDASDYSESELLALLNHPEYGYRADYIFFVNEPKSN